MRTRLGLGLASGVLAFSLWSRSPKFHDTAANGVLDAVGGTPLIELKSVSKQTGCRILVKAEHLNPGHNIKDRAAKWMIEEAEREGKLTPGTGIIVESTGGNTGIGLAMMGAARGYKCIFTMPDYVSVDKQNTMKTMGAQVILCPPVGFDDQQHFYHTAKRVAQETPGAFWINQFENLANFKAHYTSTGPEIWHQSGGRIDALCLASGTGGTISGLSTYLKERNPALLCYLIDSPGSGLFKYVTTKEFKTTGSKSKVYEGIGSMRSTGNFAKAQIDGAFDGTDREGLEMCYYLLRNEGLWVGPSSALNVVGAVKMARKLGPGKTVVTVLCDSGRSYTSTVYNPQWLTEQHMEPQHKGLSLDFVL